MEALTLQRVARSPRPDKKWRAHFSDGTVTDFGAVGYSDYTHHGNRKRRDRYIARHARDLGTADPTRPGFLSMFVLWNRPSFEASVRDYRRRLASGDWSLPT